MKKIAVKLNVTMIVLSNCQEDMRDVKPAVKDNALIASLIVQETESETSWFSDPDNPDHSRQVIMMHANIIEPAQARARYPQITNAIAH